VTRETNLLARNSLLYVTVFHMKTKIHFKWTAGTKNLSFAANF